MAQISREELTQYDLNYLWHPFTQMQEWSQQQPLFIARGEGNYLIDVDGNRYIDGVASLWANIHGHGRSEINRAIQDQLDSIAHTTLLGLTHAPAALLAKGLADISPGALQRVFYSESGSTAVEIALKMAFQYWQNTGFQEKTKFVCLSEGYHGDTIGAVSVGGIELFHEIYNPLLFQSYKVPCPYKYCKQKGISLEDGAGPCLLELEKVLDKHHKEIAALILEPLIQGAGGMLVCPPGFLKGAAELCKAYDVLLIADEVAVGFGRTGSMFACEREGVVPDLMCLGKGITGGYLPLAATLCSDRVFQGFWGSYEELRTFFHGHTYTGNPLACSAALASLELFEKDRTFENMPEKIDTLAEGLQYLSTLSPVGDVRQCGLMAGVEIFQDPEQLKAYPLSARMGHRVCMAVRRHGVILRNLGDVIVILPPLSITVSELQDIISAVERAIHETCT